MLYFVDLNFNYMLLHSYLCLYVLVVWALESSHYPIILLYIKYAGANEIKSKGIPANGGIDKLDSAVEYNRSHYRKEADRIFLVQMLLPLIDIMITRFSSNVTY